MRTRSRTRSRRSSPLRSPPGGRGGGSFPGPGPGPRRRSGFTLVELLVVIVIIAILTGLVTIGISVAMSSARASSTEAFLQSLSGACTQYATRWGDFPPSSLAELGYTGFNDTNNGGEALIACLASEKRGGRLLSVDEGVLVNTDGDSVSKDTYEKIGWFFGDGKLREVMDHFGFVITYLHHRDYAKQRHPVLKYKIAVDGETVTIKPEKSAATGTWAGPGRFQIRSVGADGKPDTADDIRGGQ